jgi:hypothetical protein
MSLPKKKKKKKKKKKEKEKRDGFCSVLFDKKWLIASIASS